MIAFASQFILLLVACCGVCPALSSSAEARMTVAFTINDKKYEVPVSSAAKRDVVEAAAGFCRAHAAEVGIAGADQAQLQHCAEALVPTFEQVLEKQQRHPKQQQEASAEGAVTAEQPPDETITAELNIGGAVYSVRFRPSQESVAAEAHHFCVQHAAIFAVQPMDPASLASCVEPVSSVLREALDGHRRDREAEAEAAALLDRWD
mmetsp:Transcript_20799/g.35027  ORF Transcript_20799/g.35027 Transcript_20799/m.35027 type:complete len:206 (+) Transcript_20799:63-680(+)